MVWRWGLGGVTVAIAALVGEPSQAETTVSSKSRAKLFASQPRLLDSRAAEQYRNSVRLQPDSVITPSRFAGPS